MVYFQTSSFMDALSVILDISTTAILAIYAHISNFFGSRFSNSRIIHFLASTDLRSIIYHSPINQIVFYKFKKYIALFPAHLVMKNFTRRATANSFLVKYLIHFLRLVSVRWISVKIFSAKLISVKLISVGFQRFTEYSVKILGEIRWIISQIIFNSNWVFT